MLTTTCHCGDVHVTIPRAPETITNCSCSICRRYGVLWAYFNRDEFRIEAAEGATETYAWGPRDIQFVRCRRCGCVTHWEPLLWKGNRVGVNARNFDPLMLGEVRIRRLDGAGSDKYIDP